jgi:hypothetical protein
LSPEWLKNISALHPFLKILRGKSVFTQIKVIIKMQAQYYTSEDFLGRKNKFLLVSCHK